jgi:hypothetical protein
MESGSHAAARKHGLRTPHADAPVLRCIPVFAPVRVGSNGFSDSFLGADRKDVCADHRPLSDARDARRSHPSPACGRGAGGEGQHAHSSASNNTFAQPFCPSLNLLAGEGPGVRANTRIPPPQTTHSPNRSGRP